MCFFLSFFFSFFPSLGYSETGLRRLKRHRNDPSPSDFFAETTGERERARGDVPKIIPLIGQSRCQGIYIYIHIHVHASIGYVRACTRIHARATRAHNRRTTIEIHIGKDKVPLFYVENSLGAFSSSPSPFLLAYSHTRVVKHTPRVSSSCVCFIAFFALLISDLTRIPPRRIYVGQGKLRLCTRRLASLCLIRP